MKYIILFFFFCFCCTIVNAQKYDNTWVIGIGYPYNANDSSSLSKIQFNNNTISIDTIERAYQIYLTNASISDPITGNLLFYTNGISVRDKRNSIMQNGDSINYGTAIWGGYKTLGYRAPYGALALPYPGHPNQYYLLHQRLLSGVPVFVNLPMDFMVTKIDMNANNGNGRVISKNISLLHDSLAYVLTATKHANGRDYWVLQQNTRGHKFYLYLLDPTGISLKSTQYIGSPLMNSQGQGPGFFSPDGTKYAFFDAYNGIYIFDFDRCTGLLSNRVVIPYDLNTSAASGFCSIMFSPNSQFLYFSQLYHLSQYDLNATDIAASKDTVAVFDGFMSSGVTRTTFMYMQQAPDGKVYIAPFSTTRYLHVIDNPDVRGLGCNVLQHHIRLPNLNFGTVPNITNYRLGVLSGSTCDTLNVATEQVAESRGIKLYPNPTNNAINITYSDWQDKKISITDVLGIQQKIVSLQNETTTIYLQNFANGFYFICIFDENGRLIGRERFVVQHE